MKRFSFFLAAVLLLVNGFLTYHFFSCSGDSGYRTEPVSFHNRHGDRVEGVLYLPGGSRESYPAMLSVHYGLQNREALQLTSSTLAKEGIAVLELILGRTRSSTGKPKSFEDYLADVNAGTDYLLEHPSISRREVFLSGHSIGANLVTTAASIRSDTAGVIAVGYPVEFPPSSPTPLLVTFGIYDELHELSKMRGAFDRTSFPSLGRVVESPAEILQLSDSFSSSGSVLSEASDSGRGGVRVFLVSYLSDHYLEPTDVDIAIGSVYFIRRVIEDSGGTFSGRKISPVPYRLKLLGRVLFYFSFVLIALYLLGYLYIRLSARMPVFALTRLSCLVFLLVFVLSLVFSKPADHLLHVCVVSGTLLAMLSFNHFVSKIRQRGSEFPISFDDFRVVLDRDIVRVLIFVAIMYGAFTAGLYLHAGINAYAGFFRFFRTIIGVLYMLPGHLYVLVSRLNGVFLEGDWTFRSIPWIVVIVTVGELIYPGGTFRLVDEFFSRVLRQLQELDFGIKWSFNVPSMILLIILIIAGISVWRHILSEGYVMGLNELFSLIYLFFCFIIVPVGIVTFLIRHPYFKNPILKMGETPF